MVTINSSHMYVHPSIHITMSVCFCVSIGVCVSMVNIFMKKRLEGTSFFTQTLWYDHPYHHPHHWESLHDCDYGDCDWIEGCTCDGMMMMMVRMVGDVILIIDVDSACQNLLSKIILCTMDKWNGI